MARDHLVQQRGVQHRARAGSALVQRRRAGDQAVSGHRAVGGLHPDRGGQRGWLADRPAGVRPDRQWRLERRKCRRASAARTAGHAVDVPRVAGGPVRGVLGGRAHRELVHVGLAKDRDARRPQPRGDRGVVRRRPALEDLRTTGGRHVGGGVHVLERQRHTGQRRRQRLPGGHRLVHARPRRPAPCPRRRAGTRGSGRRSRRSGPGRHASPRSTTPPWPRSWRQASPRRAESVRRLLTRPPPGSAGRRTGRRPPWAPAPALRPASGTARRCRAGRR